MKKLTKNLQHRLQQSQMDLCTIGWSGIYDDEYELIYDLMRVNCDPHIVPKNKLPKEYQYLRSFQMYYNKEHKLTTSQLSKLKKLAYSIAYVLYCE